MLRIILFDVEHGFCAFIRTPTGYTLLVDCGKAPNFSPVEYIRKHELAGTAPFNGHQLTKLIVTHPHEDHIEDIARLVRDMPPAILHRQQYNWGYVKGDKAAPALISVWTPIRAGKRITARAEPLNPTMA